MLKTIKEVFDYYTENENTEKFNILHLFDTGVKCSDGDTGYHDSRHFELYGFNSDHKTYKYLGIHDGLNTSILDNPPELQMVRIFEDGSTMIRFTEPICIDYTVQAAYLAQPLK